MTGRVIAVGNLKGGTGKSTISLNLACALATATAKDKAGKRVSLVDVDEQGTATEWASGGTLPIAVEHMPAGDGNQAHKAWLDRLRELREAHDYVVLDMPPQMGAALSLALLACDMLLVPVTPSGADLTATAKALALLADARKVRGEGMPRCMLVPSKVDRRTAGGREIEAVLHEMGEPVAPAIVQRSAHVDAFTAREWIGAYAPRTSAHDEIEALAAIIRRVK